MAIRRLLVVLLVVVVLLIGVPPRGSEGAWCVCRPDVAEAALQKALVYACGHGADCAPVAPSGACYSPNTVAAHCSYAANSYFQRNGQARGATCDFGGAATLSSTDPSSGTCKYPATASAAGTSTGTGTVGTSTGAGTTTTTTTTSPGSATAATGGTPIMGGTFATPIGGASGPTTSAMNPDGNEAPSPSPGRLPLLCSIASLLLSSSLLAR
uniref:X8 domain-containing protein n=1 Tax=Oryza brachyantha TaxID=4533 RepID=J3L4D3_ORYBR